MFRPIPSRILKSTAVVSWCTGTDVYQKQQYAYITVYNVHLQPSNDIAKSRDNTDLQLSGTLFVDARRSKPQLEWDQMLNEAHRLGGDLRVEVRGVTYTVISAHPYRDDSDLFHHWEIGVR